jgi:hypothetical protein
VHNEVRNEHRWIDALILRCLEIKPERRFADAGRLLAAIETCEQGGELPLSSVEERQQAVRKRTPEPPRAPTPEMDELFREVRRLLASRAYDQVIDRLGVHRPPEWSVVDGLGARALRGLGQAYLGRGELTAARECLEQLRGAQKEQAVLPAADYAAALSDLVKCYRALGQPGLAEACREEARLLLQG